MRLLELARDQGLTHVAITDHETIDGALLARAAQLDEIEVIVGQEVRTSDGDLILLYVSQVIPAGLSPAQTVEYARDQGCIIGLPHPFDFRRPSIGRSAASIRDMQRLAALVDYVEVHNGRVRDLEANARASDFARDFNLPGVAVTDCHGELEIGKCYVDVKQSPATPSDLLSELVGGRLRVRTPQASLPNIFQRLRDRLGNGTEE